MLTTVKAHAKVNLLLGVGPARADGFHELSTVFMALDLFDVLTITPGSGKITVTGRDAHKVPVDGSNLISKAAALFPQVAPVDVAIAKNIPVAGGMAGGSANAAAMLRYLQQAGNLSDAEVLAAAAQLGSDVPFTVVGGVQHGTGRGEKLTPVPCTGEFWFCFALSDKGCSTPEVYATVDKLREQGLAAPTAAQQLDAQLAALAAGDVHALAAAIANDLQPATLALRPDLEPILTYGERQGALAAFISGSGPTIAMLAESKAAAEQLAINVGYMFGVATLVACGPAAGATIQQD